MKHLVKALKTVALDRSVSDEVIQLFGNDVTQEELQTFVEEKKISDPEEISELTFDLGSRHQIYRLSRPKPATPAEKSHDELKNDEKYLKDLYNEIKSLALNFHISIDQSLGAWYLEEWFNEQWAMFATPFYDGAEGIPIDLVDHQGFAYSPKSKNRFLIDYRLTGDLEDDAKNYIDKISDLIDWLRSVLKYDHRETDDTDPYEHGLLEIL